MILNTDVWFSQVIYWACKDTDNIVFGVNNLFIIKKCIRKSLICDFLEVEILYFLCPYIQRPAEDFLLFLNLVDLLQYPSVIKCLPISELLFNAYGFIPPMMYLIRQMLTFVEPDLVSRASRFMIRFSNFSFL